MEFELKVKNTTLSFKRNLDGGVWLDDDAMDLTRMLKATFEVVGISPSFIASHLKSLCDEEDKK